MECIRIKLISIADNDDNNNNLHDLVKSIMR